MPDAAQNPNTNANPDGEPLLADRLLREGTALTDVRARSACGRRFLDAILDMAPLEQGNYLRTGAKVFGYLMEDGRRVIAESLAERVLAPLLVDFIAWTDIVSTRHPQIDPTETEVLAQVQLLGAALASVPEAVVREAGCQKAIGILHSIKVKRADFMVREALAAALIARTNPEMDPDPWPDPVDGAQLLDAIRNAYLEYIVLDVSGAVALTLYTMLTHTYDAYDILPNLRVKSPTKRCGKTRVLEIGAGLMHRPLAASNASAAAIYRSIELWHPTLLLDEVDSFLTGSHFNQTHEDLRNVVNSGHTRATAFVLRVTGDKHDEPKKYSTWAPKVLASIGDLPDTIEDRSITVTMRRKLPSEVVRRWRHTYMAQLLPLQRQAARWGRDTLAQLREADPEVPDTLNDRQQDCWRPLLAIADAAGGAWPALARRAAQVLSDVAEEQAVPTAQQLLADIRSIFYATPVPMEQLSTRALLMALCALPENGWVRYVKGAPMTDRELSQLLTPFGIVSKNLRVMEDDPAHGPGAQTPHIRKGYALEDLTEAFRRYLPARPPAEAPVSPRTPMRRAGFDSPEPSR